jgi:hypothetical protein
MLNQTLLPLAFAVLAPLLPGLLTTATAKELEQEALKQELTRRTQELFDSLVSGDREPWRKYFADDAIYFDEKGHNMTKEALVASITPLPHGYSGEIKIKDVASRFLSDAVILSYELAETETIFGQNMSARYHETDTWVRRGDAWQILAAQAFRYYEDPAIGQSDVQSYPKYVGTYELAPGELRAVTAESGNLYVERKGKREQLWPESGNVFFRKGVEGRILFRSGSNDEIDALIDRRNNEDVVWRKIK